LAEIGSGRKVDTETNSTFGKVVWVLGEAEWAAIQTLHVADSVAFECWWAANAIADQNASNRHSKAMLLDIERTTATPPIRCLNVYQKGKRTQRGT
jgi:hypothetical protein